MKEHNIDGSELSFAQDNLLQFVEETHTYSTADLGTLKSVSDVVKYFFAKFDEVYWSRKKTETEEDAERLRETWEIKRRRASEIGTHLHLQIENYLNSRTEPQFNGTFNFAGKFYNINEEFSIAREWQYFLNFDRDTDYHPFRAEWRVFDPEHRIAGTIDLACRRPDGTFELYDWKRSNKIDPEENNPWASSINGLNGVTDTSYMHYCLQQNLYRYILEKNYGVKVERMNLVVLHPDLPAYKIVPVREMSSQVRTMLENFKR